MIISVKVNSAVKAVLIILVFLSAIIQPPTSFAQTAATTIPNYSNDYLTQNHQNSLLLYENFIQREGWWTIDNCFSSGKIVTDTSEFDTVCMPDFISSTSPPPSSNCTSKMSGNIATAAIIRGAFAGLTLIAAPTELLIMTDVCTNGYVIEPYEYLNRLNNLTCTLNNGYVTYDPASGTPLTASDVPFFYHCDPLYDPSTGQELALGSTDANVAAKIGHTWGYMGTASQYCVGNSKNNAAPALVGAVVFEMLPGASKVFGNFTYCQGANLGQSVNVNGSGNSRYTAILKPPVPTDTGTLYAYIDVTAYYKYFPDIGKVQICVGSPYTLFPIRIGCGSVAPPGEDNDVDPFLVAYVSGTRCQYLISQRDDLNSLGNAMLGGANGAVDETGANRTAVANFLASDLHITSTVVGCIKDMLQQIFIAAPSSISGGPPPFFQVVQTRLKQIIFSVLVLYVSIVGIRIMTSPQPPQKAEFIMWIIKYGLVMYFALGDAFYATDSSGNVVGLYPQLLAVSDEIANLFLQAQNQYDPVGYCTYIMGNLNILGETMVNTSAFSNLTPTAGYDGIKMTVWDLVDCKLINYLNGGSCNYTIGGLTLVWVSSLSLFVSGGDGILLAIVTFTYCFLLLLVIFKFAHIFILAAIIITIMLFLAPIFVCFYLFEVTKGIFEKWMKVIFGYMLYPALLFAFLALMLATLDSIYYGPLNTTVDLQSINGNPSGGTQLGQVSIQTMCSGVDSLFCDINGASNFSAGLCEQPTSYLFNNMSQSVSVQGVNKSFSALNTSSYTLFSKYMTKLMLFALLFYLFMNSASEFMAALLAVQPISMAKGGINALDILQKAGGAAASGIKKVAGAATKK